MPSSRGCWQSWPGACSRVRRRPRVRRRLRRSRHSHGTFTEPYRCNLQRSGYEAHVSSDSTLHDVRRDAHVGRWARRVGLTVLLLVVIAGAAGLFGVRSRTTVKHAGAYTLTVTYPQVARAGLDVPWRLRV